jgi:Heparan-alpha-glucosaminide N-acetyltransferase, catalytic
MQHTKTSAYRLEYIDWVRGFGALIMLQGHVFDSFLRPDLRPGGAYVLSQFVGGMPPAIFLFLTGVTLSFLMDSSERKGMARWDRVVTAFRRSGYLFGLAFAFRVQLFIFGFPAAWQDLFRVDILNCMGFSIALLSLMAFFRTRQRIAICAAAGFGIALASPLISSLNWSGVPWLVRNYIIPSKLFFGFFPWGAYLAFGMSAGSLIRATPRDGIARMMQWVALAGAATVIACQYLAHIPFSIYRHADFWLDSPAQVLTKQGATWVMLGFAFLWTRYGAGEGWSFVRQFGTTSLLVYWVHIELVYGRGLWFLKNSLNVPQTMVAAAFMILLMLALSTARTNWPRISQTLAEMGWYNARPERVPAD